MAKQIKSKEELQEMIREEAAKHAECNETYIGDVYWHEMDNSGCNWSVSTVRSLDWPACYERIQSFAINLRGTFNIPDER